MSRSNQQLARSIKELIKAVQSGRLSVLWIAGGVVLVVGYFLLQPVLERSLGVDLPGWAEVAETDSPPRTTSSNPSPSASTDRQLQSILVGESRETYVSPAGLRYTRGSQHGHRVRHLMAHARDEPDRPGQHGVFSSSNAEEIFALVDEAYLQAQSGRDTQTDREDDRMIYEVNLRRQVGYIGGTSGKRRGRPAAQHVRLVIEGDRLITAFPVIP